MKIENKYKWYRDKKVKNYTLINRKGKKKETHQIDIFK